MFRADIIADARAAGQTISIAAGVPLIDPWNAGV
jgi:hypothetical protein